MIFQKHRFVPYFALKKLKQKVRTGQSRKFTAVRSLTMKATFKVVNLAKFSAFYVFPTGTLEKDV